MKSGTRRLTPPNEPSPRPRRSSPPVAKSSEFPPSSRPGLDIYWHARGQKRAFSQRRAELRAVAKTRIAAIEKDTCLKIELHSVELQTQLLKQALTSKAAMAFLDSLAAVDTLMPVLELAKIQQILESRVGFSKASAQPECTTSTVAKVVAA